MSERRVKRGARGRSRKPDVASHREGLSWALGDFAAGLDASARPSMIIGGVAVIARGVPRLTRDVDGTVAGEGTDLDALLATLARHYITPRIGGAVDFARANQVLLLQHALGR